jgi:FixJ family two-component response regulator
MNETPVVFIVDDDEAVRRAMAWTLDGAGLKYEEFVSSEDFLSRVDPQRPGCLLLDVRMPGMSGLELQHRLAKLGARMGVIIITGHADVPTAVEAMKHGAIDFLQKPIEKTALLEKVRAILKQQDRAPDPDEAEARRRLGDLTPREREVLDKIVAGRLNKEIAEELTLSPRTVEKHRAALMAKMRAETAADLVRMTLKATGGRPVSA